MMVKKNIPYLVWTGKRRFKNFMVYCHLKIKEKLYGKRHFIFNGKDYVYFNHFYNCTWENERSVEIPIIRHEMEREFSGSVLEVGGVLPNYFKPNYDIVDKYNKLRGVINVDIMEFKPLGKYDLIVSISTLEHIGFDNIPKDPKKPLKVVNHMKKLLSKNGRLIITVPVGYNPGLDNMIENGELKFDRVYYLKRTSENRWIQTDRDGIKNIKFGCPFPNANALIIGICGKKRGNL